MKNSKIDEETLKQVTGGTSISTPTELIDYDEEVSNIILSNKDIKNNTTVNFTDHYIIITEINKRFSPDKYGRMTILVNMSIRYEVYTNDNIKIKEGYISDFIM